jgi:hypothetical protein
MALLKKSIPSLFLVQLVPHQADKKESDQDAEKDLHGSLYISDFALRT